MNPYELPLVRPLEQPDIEQLLSLYTHLHEEEASMSVSALQDLWTQIPQDQAQVYVGAFVDGELSAAANVCFVPNLTRAGRPFATIENVVTHPSRRRLGLARAVVSRILDGVYARNAITRELEFHALPTPTPSEMADIARRTAQRLDKLLHAQGRSLLLEEYTDPEPPSLELEHPALAACYDAASRGLAVSGDHAGQLPLRLVQGEGTRI